MAPFDLQHPAVTPAVTPAVSLADARAGRSRDSLVRCLFAAVLLTGLGACASGTPTVTERGAAATATTPSTSAPGSAMGGSAAAATAASTTPQAVDAGHPVGVVAIGHSGLTGFRSDPATPEENAFANSWATGTNPVVDSIYARLVRAIPETADHVANLARNGAQADLLPYQAQDALRLVPRPRLALVEIMDNDIRCDGTDPAHYSEFRAYVRQAVTVLTQASPGVTVMLVSGPGRPARYAAAIASLPKTPVELVGTGPCQMFPANKVVDKAEVTRLTGLMEAYESELARACTGIPQCHTDAGAATKIPDTLDGYAVDRGHQSVIGHARTAAAVWPEVAKALGLPAG